MVGEFAEEASPGDDSLHGRDQAKPDGMAPRPVGEPRPRDQEAQGLGSVDLECGKKRRRDGRRSRVRNRDRPRSNLRGGLKAPVPRRATDPQELRERPSTHQDEEGLTARPQDLRQGTFPGLNRKTVHGPKIGIDSVKAVRRIEVLKSGDPELGAGVHRLRLSPRHLDHSDGRVDAQDRETATLKPYGIVARSASDVEKGRTRLHPLCDPFRQTKTKEPPGRGTAESRVIRAGHIVERGLLRPRLRLARGRRGTNDSQSRPAYPSPADRGRRAPAPANWPESEPPAYFVSVLRGVTVTASSFCFWSMITSFGKSVLMILSIIPS